MYKLPDAMRAPEIKSFEDIHAYYDETLDISFCELKENVEFIQPEWDFGAYKIDAGHKVFLNLDESCNPSFGLYYGFCGRIHPEFNGAVSKTIVVLKEDLEYITSAGRYHIFHTQNVIEDKNDFEGCSGAPVLDETGRLVGLASSVNPGSKTIFVFSIAEAKSLLNIALDNGLL